MARANLSPELQRIADDYDEHRRALKAARKRDREKAAARRAARPHRHLDPVQEDRIERAIARAEDRADVITRRYRDGYLWPGGGVGCNNLYGRPRERFEGLVSDQHPLLQAFVARLPRAGLGDRGLLSGHHKALVSRGDSKVLALDEEYVVANPAMRTVLRVDLDAIFDGSFAAVRQACTMARTRQPHFVVGHVDRQGRLHRPHLIWLLENAVCFTAKGRAKPKARWWRVLRGLTAALAPFGADPGALSNPLRCKNPVSPLWSLDVTGDRLFSLDDLSRGLRLDVSDDELLAASKSKPAPDPGRLLDQSNGLFLAAKAYAASIVSDWISTRDEAAWTEEIVSQALAWSGNDSREQAQARRVGTSVASWTWRRARRRSLSPDERKTSQQDGQARTAEKRRLRSWHALLQAYRAIVAAGQKPTQLSVERASGLSESTVKRHWRALLAAVQTDATKPEPAVHNFGFSCSAIDKKGVPSTAAHGTHPDLSQEPPSPTPAAEAPAKSNCTPLPVPDFAAWAAARLERAGQSASTTPKGREQAYCVWLAYQRSRSQEAAPVALGSPSPEATQPNTTQEEALAEDLTRSAARSQR